MTLTGSPRRRQHAVMCGGRFLLSVQRIHLLGILGTAAWAAAGCSGPAATAVDGPMFHGPPVVPDARITLDDAGCIISGEDPIPYDVDSTPDSIVGHVTANGQMAPIGYGYPVVE